MGGFMPHFYFNLDSNSSRIPDDTGKELGDLHAAYKYGRKLIGQILYHVGSDDSDDWKLVISNENRDALLIIPFPKGPDTEEAGSRRIGSPSFATANSDKRR
jgi:Domain of unknown function (DUF6894)